MAVPSDLITVLCVSQHILPTKRYTNTSLFSNSTLATSFFCRGIRRQEPIDSHRRVAQSKACRRRSFLQKMNSPCNDMNDCVFQMRGDILRTRGCIRACARTEDVRSAEATAEVTKRSDVNAGQHFAVRPSTGTV